jgi:hypothetical protein
MVRAQVWGMSDDISGELGVIANKRKELGEGVEMLGVYKYTVWDSVVGSA